MHGDTSALCLEIPQFFTNLGGKIWLFRNNPYLRSILTLKPRLSCTNQGGKVRMTLWKGVYLALWFWRCKNFANSNQFVKNKATVDATGYVSCVSRCYTCAARKVADGMAIWSYRYISAWGLRCSFRQTGQCEGLYIVRRATGTGSHAFLLYIKV